MPMSDILGERPWYGKEESGPSASSNPAEAGEVRADTEAKNACQRPR